MTFSPSRAPTSRTRSDGRSEEHTSELQSRSDIVCRLLLEKKKTNPSPRVTRAPSANSRSQIRLRPKSCTDSNRKQFFSPHTTYTSFAEDMIPATVIRYSLV